MKPLQRVVSWAFILFAVFAAGLFIVRQPLLARLGVSLPLGKAEVTEISLPDGFNMTVFAEGLSTPRFMAVGPDGTVFLAELGRNQVVALPYNGGDGGVADVTVIAENLGRPSSLAFRPGTSELYVGGTTGLTHVEP